MSIWEAILLGIVQGLTEFLPISSSGHLILVPWLQDYTFLRENPDFNKTFDVALHIGTLIGVVYYFRRELWAMVRGFLRTVATRTIEDADGRLAWVVIVGTIPAVIVGGLGSVQRLRRVRACQRRHRFAHSSGRDRRNPVSDRVNIRHGPRVGVTIRRAIPGGRRRVPESRGNLAVVIAQRQHIRPDVKELIPQRH